MYIYKIYRRYATSFADPITQRFFSETWSVHSKIVLSKIFPAFSKNNAGTKKQFAQHVDRVPNG